MKTKKSIMFGVLLSALVFCSCAELGSLTIKKPVKKSNYTVLPDPKIVPPNYLQTEYLPFKNDPNYHYGLIEILPYNNFTATIKGRLKSNGIRHNLLLTNMTAYDKRGHVIASATCSGSFLPPTYTDSFSCYIKTRPIANPHIKIASVSFAIKDKSSREQPIPTKANTQSFTEFKSNPDYFYGGLTLIRSPKPKITGFIYAKVYKKRLSFNIEAYTYKGDKIIFETCSVENLTGGVSTAFDCNVTIKDNQEIAKTVLKLTNPNTDDIITSFSGSGGANTQSFNTTGPWEIQWDVENINKFLLYLVAVDGGSIEGINVSNQGIGRGTSYHSKAGKYYLRVHATGKWKINIVPMK